MAGSSTTTQWILELMDKVTAPMRKIAKSSEVTERAIGMVDSKIDRLKTQSKSFSNTIAKLGLGVSLLATLSAGAKGFIQFEDSMAVANTMANKSGADYEKLQSQIKGIAEVVPTAREEIAKGLYETISAGVPENNWVQFLQDSSKAAIAGQAQVGTVVGATSTIIKNYGKQWDEALSIQDKFQRTVKLGQIPSLEALAESLPRVTAVAAKLNVTENELLGTFATASGPMGSTSEVATQLNATLNAMLKPSAEATDAAKKLGIAFDAKSITRAGGLQNYINELMPRIEAFSKQTGVNQEELVGKLFGSQEAIKLVLGLGGELGASWSKNTAEVTSATGDVQTAFGTMAQTTKAQMQLAKNSFNNAMDEMMVAAQPTLMKLLQVGQSVFKMVGHFMKANPTLTKFVTVGALVSAALGVGIIMFNYASIQVRLFNLNLKKLILSQKLQAVWTKIVTAAQWLWNAAMDANPIGIVIAAIAALVAIVMYAWNKFGWFRGAIYATWEAIKGFAVAIKDLVINRIKEMLSGITGIGKTLMLFFKGDWKAAWETGKKAVSDLTGIGGDAQKKFVNDMKGVGNKAATAYHEGVAEVDAKKKKKKETTGLSLGSVLPNTTPEVDTKNLTNFAGNATGNLDTSGGNTNGLKGAGKEAGKTVTMNLDIKNYFNIDGNWRNDIDKIADAVTGKINDRLRDSLISL
ncbi:phage tail tape measure protein [Yeosuana marina]|uniref:phage tail tape measure protein n=1 Tax=Yeosuana marina TaxID=1565536 RepID=UPI001423286D|nr:phage tail tape measure protein [Yeosuana marina]